MIRKIMCWLGFHLVRKTDYVYSIGIPGTNMIRLCYLCRCGVLICEKEEE